VATRSLHSPAQTPVDLTPYTEVARLRAESVAVAAQPRLSIARRPLLDLPLAVNGGVAPVATAGAGEPTQQAPDLDLGANFDVPAFLRRQEG
jgi:hypothetical protein